MVSVCALYYYYYFSIVCTQGVYASMPKAMYEENYHYYHVFYNYGPNFPRDTSK